MKKEVKLQLNKITIQDLDSALDREEQKAVRGGSVVYPAGTTNIAVYCQP